MVDAFAKVKGAVLTSKKISTTHPAASNKDMWYNKGLPFMTSAPRRGLGQNRIIVLICCVGNKGGGVFADVI